MGPGEPVRSWLEPRLEEVPEELAEAVRDAVRRGLEALEAASGSADGGGTGVPTEAPDTGTTPGAGEGPGSPEDPAAARGEPEAIPHGFGPDRAAPEPLPDPSSVPDTLAWIAVRELDRVADAPRDHDAAVRLLAADASLTWAFEAAAELDEELEGLADRSGLHGRIGRLLDRTGDDVGGEG